LALASRAGQTMLAGGGLRDRARGVVGPWVVFDLGADLENVVDLEQRCSITSD